MQPGETLIPSSGSRESATPADWRLVAFSLAVVALSAFYVASNYRAAFPQASLRLDLSRDEITARAGKFLTGRGHRLEAYRDITLFDADDDARLFLEREAGLEQANRLMESEVPVWRWQARWYRPPEKEEFRVWLSPAGRLVGFDHVVPEDAPGEKLEVEAARTLAEAFLRERVSWPSRPVEAQSEDKPKRRDHTFTFERTGFEVKDGRIRATVVVRGGQVEAYQESLRVPEQWQRDFAALRSKNQLYSQIAQAFYIALMVAAGMVLIGALRRGESVWRPVVWFCSVVAGLNVLAQWNNLPFALNSLPTTTPIGQALVMILFQSAGAGAGVFIYVIFAAAPGLVAYRDLLPGKLNLGSAFSRRALDTREFFRAAVSGLGFAAFHLGFVTAFYLVGQRFGVWSPQDVEQSDLLSTFAPWLYPLTTSLLAASAEEFWFRLLSVPLLKRWTGSTAVAIIVPAFVWGFLHANYPQQPGYIRGLEVGIIGVGAGWLMLRFGILSTLIWHYTVDAILFSTYLFASGGLALRLSGFAVSGLALAPLAVCWWRYRQNGGFAVEPSLTNAAVSHSHCESAPAAPLETAPPIEPALKPTLLYAVAAALALVALLLKAPVPGDFVRVGVTRQEAQRAAGPPAEGERQVVEFAANLDGDTFEYLRQQVGREEANRIIRERTLTGVWRIRQFAPSRKNEVYKYVDASGKLFRHDYVRDEKEAGENLATADARKLAEAFAASDGVDLSKYRLVDSSTEKRDRRTDHSFVWEDESFRGAGEARARVSADVIGASVSAYRRFIKLPEQWQREYRKPRLLQLLLPAVAGGFAFMIIGLFLRFLRRTPFRPMRYLGPAALAVALMLSADLNEWPQFYSGYSTEQPLADFHSDYAVSLAMRVVLAGAGVFLAAYMLDVLLYMLQGERRRAPLSLPLALACVAIAAGAQRLMTVVEAMVPGERLSVTMWKPPPVDAWSPALAVMLNAGLAAVVGSVVMALAASTVVFVCPPRRLPVYALAFAACWGLSRSESIPLMLYHCAAVLLMLALAWLVVSSLAVSVETLAWSIFLAGIAGGAVGLWRQSASDYRLEAVIAAVLGAAAATVAWVLSRRRRFLPLIAPALLLLSSGCGPRVTPFDYAGKLGVVTVINGDPCFFTPIAQPPGSTLLIVRPEPETGTLKASISTGGNCKRDALVGHSLDLHQAEPLTAIGVLLNGQQSTLDLDGDGRPERFRSCSSGEGLHFTVWSGAERRWHAYHYLGYDTENTCTEAEIRPE